MMFDRIKTKGLFFLILLLGQLFIFKQSAYCTHIAAGEVTYTCLGDSTYEISIEFFKSCLPRSASGISEEIILRVYDQDDNFVSNLPNGGYIRLNLISNDTLDLNIQTDCIVFSKPFCIQLLVFRGIARLPYLEGGYRLYHNRCCRNISSNISSPTSQKFVFAGNISDYSLRECDSGIKFKNWPPLNVCLHTPIEFDHSLENVLGDQVVYKFCELYSGNFQDPPFNVIPWANSYGLDNLIGGENPLRIHSQTGLITGIPEVIGSFTIGVCVDEYLEGELIRTHRRDFQIAVADCHDFFADFFSPELFCNAGDLQFENLTIGHTHLEWYFGGLDNPIGISIEEDPVFSFPEAGSYEVVLIAYHQERECRDTISKTFIVQNREIEIFIDKERGPCGDTLLLGLTAILDHDSTFSFDVFWEIRIGNRYRYFHELDILVEIPFAEEIHIYFRGIDQVSGCWITHTEIIRTGIISGAGGDFIIATCDDFVELNPSYYEGYDYYWYPDTFMLDPVTTPNPRVNPSIPTTYTVQIVNEFCTGEKRFHVTLLNDDIKLFPDTLCNQRTIKVDENPFLGIANRFQWRFYLEGHLIGSSISNFPSVTFPAYGNASISIIPFRPELDGCIDTFTQNIFLVNQELEIFPDFELGSCGDSIQVLIGTHLSGNISDNNTFMLINDFTNDTLVNSDGYFEFYLKREVEVNFQLVVKSDLGCVFIETFSILPDILVHLSGNSKYSICFGDTLELKGPDIEGFDFEWQITDFFISTENTRYPLVRPDSSIIYSLLTIVDDCEYLFTFEVEVEHAEAFDLADMVICDSVLEHRLYLPYGGDFDEILWIIGDINDPEYTSRQINPLVEFKDFGEKELWILISDTVNCGKLFHGNILLSDVSQWHAVIEMIESSCFDDEVRILLNGRVEGHFSAGLDPEYLWVVNEVDTFLSEDGILDLQLIGVDDIRIQLIVKDEYGCSLSDFEMVVFEMIDKDQFLDSLIICRGDTVNLLHAADPSLSYIWSPAFGFIGSLTESNPAVSPEHSILYRALISSANCSANNDVFVEVNQGPMITALTADPNILIEPGESLLLLEAEGDIIDIYWTPPESLDNPLIFNPIAFPEVTTTYTVVVTDAMGCKQTAEVTVFIEERPCAPPFVFLPTAFSPNGDGVNDVLYVRGENIISMELRIYNRFGQQVFLSNDQNRGWDGTFQGEASSVGVYAYHLVVECAEGVGSVLKGNINLIR